MSKVKTLWRDKNLQIFEEFQNETADKKREDLKNKNLNDIIEN